MSKFIFTLFLSLSLLPFTTFAQGFFGSGFLFDELSLRIEAEPQYPGPNQEVVLTLEGVDRDAPAEITWYVDGERVKTGIGAFQIQVKTKEVGEITTIRVVATQGERVAEKTLRINPGSVDILWEAHTYTPPFYRGKALPVSQTPITLLALPNIKKPDGTALGNKNLVYTWKQNYTRKSEQSGYGQTSAVVNSDYENGVRQVGVMVATPDKALGAVRRIQIPTRDPELLFYTNNTRSRLPFVLEDGVFWDGDTLELTAIGYYFPFSSSTNNPGMYTWELAGEEVEITGQKNKLLLRLPEENGRTSVSLSVQNSQQILQGANKEMRIRF